MDPINILCKLLNSDISADLALAFFENSEVAKAQRSRYSPIKRALKNLRYSKFKDFCGHIRQCMTYYEQGFQISKNFKDILVESKDDFKFLFSENGDYVYINGLIAKGINDIESKFRFEEKNSNTSTIGDGYLYRYFGYKTYSSLSQKTLLYLVAHMKKNETILACLPTGKGKSLSWQLPAVSKHFGGLIIVVVPTIALAIDHEKSSSIIFENSFDYCSKPKAYFSGTSTFVKNEIFKDITNGQLPVLYISPEAVLNDRFKELILESTRKGLVSALFIDEAHLAVNWGISFRPEFQILAAFKKQLEQVAPLGIKTVLLSATYTEYDVKVLKKLFGEGVFTEFRADELRSELEYYIKECSSEEERLDIMKRIVFESPKPLIVYTLNPKQAENYFELLKRSGLENIGIFTGITSGEERERIIRLWNNDEIDIIVATSAFGMGVDKADIRTIITAYIPESISRYYQEVGRSGRDGYSSLNYFLTCKDIDYENIADLTKSTILTSQTTAERWKALLQEAEYISQDQIWIDVSTPPDYLKFDYVGGKNKAWNKVVALSLSRANLIDIEDVRITNIDEYKLLLRLKNTVILENSLLLANYIDPYRDKDRESINSAVNRMKNMLSSYKNKCLSELFVEEFPYSIEVCSGCPNCRKKGLNRLKGLGRIEVFSDKEKLFDGTRRIISSVFDANLTYRSNFMISTKSDSFFEINHVIEQIILRGINIVIVPRDEEYGNIVKSLSEIDRFGYMIITLDEAKMLGIKWIDGYVAGIYTNSVEYNRCVNEFLNLVLKYKEGNRVIHVVNGDYFDKVEQKPLSEIVDYWLNSEDL